MIITEHFLSDIKIEIIENIVSIYLNILKNESKFEKNRY